MAEVNLNGTVVGDNHPAYIISEIGHNHQGDIEKALDLVDIAARVGANAVKTQKRSNKDLYTKEFYNSPYNSENAYGATYGEHREALELGHHEYKEIQSYAASRGLEFFATAFDIPSVDFLEKVGVPFYKVASGSVTNLELLRYIARTGKPVIMSFGGCSWEDIQRAVDAVAPINSQLVLLHCVASYPAPVEYLNLPRIEDLAVAFPEFVIGFSDHQDGISAGPVAFTLGARVFEKHLTFSHSAKGTDHAFSLEEEGLRQYIKSIGRARLALKEWEQPLEIEKKPIYKMRQSIYAARYLPSGTWLRERDMVLQTPENGVAAWWYEFLVGRVLKEDVKEGEPIRSTHVEGGLGV